MPNRDDVIRIAREAGYDIEAGHSIRESSDLELFTRFAQLVAAQAAAEEREACAKACDSLDEGWGIEAFVQCANAIRARGTA